jgi:SAM-dependent methyltransferase
VRLSFRDPDGFVFHSGERIFRCVLPHAAAGVRSFLSAPGAAAWMREGVVVRSTPLDPPFTELPQEWRGKIPPGAVVLEHAPVRFPSYPYEWPPEMLHSAASCTLMLAQAALASGFILKDATPYNVMFEGPKPVFIDLLSFQPREALDPLWRAYAQFVRTFVYPLLATQYFGLDLNEILLPHRDGLEPEKMLRLCPFWRLLLPPFLGAVAIPALFSGEAITRRPETYRPRLARNAGEAKFLLDRLLRRAQRLLRAVQPKPQPGADSYETSHTYSAPALVKKENFVLEMAGNSRTVLDLGCNTGRFSLLAAGGGRSVVAIDRDPAAVSLVWRRARETGLDVLPLVADITRPPGGTGWANRECAAFLDRARGRFDCVLALALLHHLQISERVPLDAIFELLFQLTTRLAIVEYVGPEDSQFRRLTRGREALHANLTVDAFETAARRLFEIAGSCELTPTRKIYAMTKKEC